MKNSTIFKTSNKNYNSNNLETFCTQLEKYKDYDNNKKYVISSGEINALVDCEGNIISQFVP